MHTRAQQEVGTRVRRQFNSRSLRRRRWENLGGYGGLRSVNGHIGQFPSAWPRRGATCCDVSQDLRQCKTLPTVAAMTHSPVVIYVIYYLILLVFRLVGQWFMASVQPPAQVAKATTVAFNILPKKPRLSSGNWG